MDVTIGALIALVATCLGIVSWITKFFTSSISKKDELIAEQNRKLELMVRDNIESRTHLVKSIDANTNATNTSAKNLERLILQIIRQQK